VTVETREAVDSLAEAPFGAPGGSGSVAEEELLGSRTLSGTAFGRCELAEFGARATSAVSFGGTETSVSADLGKLVDG
jgi:hypothetical protein